MSRAAAAAVGVPARLAPLLVAAAAVYVFWHAAGLYFAQDDFAALGRAAGEIPRFTAPWRWLALQGYFDVMWPLAGLDARPYHLVNLAGHALASMLVFRLLARFVRRAAAFAGGVFFAAHPASFTAVFWISTVGDLYALVFALIALECLGREDRLRHAAIPAFALSLLCKESLLLLPLVALLWRLRPWSVARPAPRGPADGALIGTALVALAYLAYFIAAHGLAAPPAPGAEPYAVTFGRHWIDNALTYLGWTANPWLPTVSGWSDAADPAVYGWGAALALAAVAGAFVPALRTRGWLHALVLYAAWLAPVLPLARHTYHYYLYGALAGAALAVAALLDALLAWWLVRPAARGTRARTGPSPRAAGAAWAVAGLLAAAFAVNGRAMAEKIERTPFRHPELRSEPVVDRARIAARVRDGIAAAPALDGRTVVFWSPESRAQFAAPGDPRETYWERNVRTALYDGLAVRLFAPGVDSVAFATEIDPADSALWAIYDLTGRTRVVDTPELLRMVRSAPGP